MIMLLRQVIATMCEELPPDSIMLIYVSSSLGNLASFEHHL